MDSSGYETTIRPGMTVGLRILHGVYTEGNEFVRKNNQVFVFEMWFCPDSSTSYPDSLRSCGTPYERYESARDADCYRQDLTFEF
jgi:hypothetical protein